MPALVPARQRGVEYLDDPQISESLRARSLGDVARANTLFGGTRAVLRELAPLLMTRRGRRLTLLDVGTGAADIPAAVRGDAQRLGVRLTVFGVDMAEPLARAAAPRLDGSLCADALALPFSTSGIDVVVCSQLLHHFGEGDIADVLCELDRVALHRVIVSDLRRSWLAAAGIWLASFPLGFHPVSRHDGVVSVLRGFTARELHTHVQAATSAAPMVRRHAGWRVTAAWTPIT